MTTTALWAEGDKFVVDGLEYELWEYNSYTIETITPVPYAWEEYTLPNMVFVTRARRDISVANIPATVMYNGVTHNVIGIRRYAFSGCYNLRAVTIPESVVSISPSAFNNSLLYFYNILHKMALPRCGSAICAMYNLNLSHYVKSADLCCFASFR